MNDNQFVNELVKLRAAATEQEFQAAILKDADRLLRIAAQKVSKSKAVEFEPAMAVDGFDEFWKVYPRRLAKQSAAIAFRRALRKTTPEQIIAGAKRYAAQCEGKEPHYIAHASTWLNAERWADEVEPAAASGHLNGMPASGHKNGAGGLFTLEQDRRTERYRAAVAMLLKGYPWDAAAGPKPDGVAKLEPWQAQIVQEVRTAAQAPDPGTSAAAGPPEAGFVGR